MGEREGVGDDEGEAEDEIAFEDLCGEDSEMNTLSDVTSPVSP